MTERDSIKEGRYFEGLSRKNHKYYEVFIPNEFTPKSPWGSYPQDKWDEWTPLLKYPECLLRDYGDCITHIPIFSVSHITHNKPAREIMSTCTLHTDGHYTFKPHLKLGREYKYDGTPLGETYKRTVKGEYKRVQRSKLDPVLPGYLSWWGIDVSPFYKTESGKRLSHHIEQIRREQYYVPGYLKESAASMYGNNCFSVSFKDILLSYQRARTDKPDHKMQLKVGGTLLYENEICYVAVICLEGDEDVQSMTAIGDHKHSRPFQHNGLVDSTGTVINPEAIPEFRAAFIVRAVEDNEFNWEQLVFALYFPDPTMQLKCSQQVMTKTNVEHKFCISLKPPTLQGGGKWVCPNELKSY